MFHVQSGAGRVLVSCGSMQAAKRRAARILSKRGGTVRVTNDNGQILWEMSAV